MKVTLDNVNELDFAKGDGLLPALIQDRATGQIRMQGYMNLEAVKQTIESQLVTFYSRSKERLWVKGESSQNVLKVASVHTDCDNDSILVLAEPAGPTCHLGTDSCFGDAKPNLAFLAELEAIQGQRLKDAPESSYTAKLAARGINKVAQKVGEEGVEVALAAVAESDEALLGESADLLYHLLLTLRVRGLGLKDVVKVLESRH
ncbi:bifunctional phosphoribosyl-AMP cyclohydrolase/phosphoribosyl-ATP diphosphatase HisIE [Gallaecimonas mangrovi]|uniref:bifunctional phosphoribosyl-AMP cyclohydrolase/phosphoribosyl-ATP diphosphatase HisIE n=1 Tax=Gallaecimonas mangrovi TaxID=2291597 RepID=UPI000E201862|nr:bifunctional phosphoribosyl-AMP cyclohydrolase/phosphoribosyl-ATP diphosphatase HisIE [Gallaecimonas mangrovi]